MSFDRVMATMSAKSRHRVFAVPCEEAVAISSANTIVIRKLKIVIGSDPGIMDSIWVIAGSGEIGSPMLKWIFRRRFADETMALFQRLIDDVDAEFGDMSVQEFVAAGGRPPLGPSIQGRRRNDR